MFRLEIGCEGFSDDVGFLYFSILHAAFDPCPIQLFHESWREVDRDHDSFFSLGGRSSYYGVRRWGRGQEHVRALPADLWSFSCHRLGAPVLACGTHGPLRSRLRVGEWVPLLQ